MLIYVYTVDNQDFQGILKVYYVNKKKKKKKKKREKISSASPKLYKHLSRDTMFTGNQDRVVQIEHIERYATYDTGAN